jgi:hypothetical protein
MFVDKDELFDDNYCQFMEEELGFEDLASKSGGSLPFKMTRFYVNFILLIDKIM